LDSISQRGVFVKGSFLSNGGWVVNWSLSGSLPIAPARGSALGSLVLRESGALAKIFDF